MYRCKNCGCCDEKYFSFNKGKIYCRRCISFVGEKAKARNINISKKLIPKLNYSLTKEQKLISEQVRKSFEDNKNVLIYAVCGAGKTEIVFDTIADALNRKLQVGFCIPRKDVVIELEQRFKEAFPDIKIVSVYGEKTEELEGDLILLTTHQLFRYPKYFDLLIIDETDAFPFSNNQVLMYHFDSAVRGNYVMMSATPLKWMLDKIKKENGIILSLYKRFHNHKIVVPTLKVIPVMQILFVIDKLKKYYKENKLCLVFVPTKDDCKKIFIQLSFFIKKIDYVHSSRENRSKIISDFKERKLQCLVTTSVLERGITIKDVQVIVYNADHDVYTSEALIQIAGRVGRKIDSYDGEVLFLAKKPTQNILDSIRKIEEDNVRAGL